MKNQPTKNRRSFIKQIAASSAAIIGAPAILTSKTNELYRNPVRYSANDQINVALIGAGIMGTEDTNTALKIPGVKLVAVCDLYKGRLKTAKEKWGDHLYTTQSYKEILARPDIDAVIIAVPDHWHKQISIDAMRAGKAAYCEKPMVHSVDEGHEVIKAQKETGMTYQVGSQGMSSLGNEKAKELLAAGAIGELNYAEGFWARHSPGGAWQYNVPKDASTETVDWDTYVSNTTKRDFDPLRFFRWRNYRDYGTGVSGDLFVHLFSSLHFVTNSKGPDKVMATGGLRYWKDGREVPDILLGMFDYPKATEHPAFNLSLRVNFVDGTSGSTYLRLVGSEGAMDVLWNDVYLRKNPVTKDPSDPYAQSKIREALDGMEPRKMMLPPKEAHYTVQRGYNGAHYDHFNNFFTGVRNKTQVAEDAIFGFRAAAPALLCNDSYFDGKTVKWDPVAMKLK